MTNKIRAQGDTLAERVKTQRKRTEEFLKAIRYAIRPRREVLFKLALENLFWAMQSDATADAYETALKLPNEEANHKLWELEQLKKDIQRLLPPEKLDGMGHPCNSGPRARKNRKKKAR